MFSLFYDTLLFLFALPRILWKSKYSHHLKDKLGLTLPPFNPKKGQEVIWIHAVSMGETRAIIPLFHKLRKQNPDAAIVISTTTETGQMEARRSLPEANAHFFLPLDFSWAIQRLLNKIQPTTLILCESDFWYHLLKLAKSRGVRIHLVNGKVSERSCQRYRAFPFLTRRLFKNFETLCVQNETYRDRFLLMGIPSQKIFVTGNLKLNTFVKKMNASERQTFRLSLGIADTNPVLVIGSTHSPEEEHILSLLPDILNKFPQLKILLAPRHPERFEEVARLIQDQGLPFRRFSTRTKGEEPIILIDAMGMLNKCYQIANAAIVGGSFTSHIGGHNIFEPIVFGVPVLFGPHMHNQRDLEELILQAKAGIQVSFDQLPNTLTQILEESPLRQSYSDACNTLSQTLNEAADRTLAKIISESC